MQADDKQKFACQSNGEVLSDSSDAPSQSNGNERQCFGADLGSHALKRRKLCSRVLDHKADLVEESQDTPVQTAPERKAGNSSCDPNADSALDAPDGDEVEQCSVCLDAMSAQTKYTLPSCRHSFHLACILQTFRRMRCPRCPYCRGTGDAPTLAGNRVNGASLPTMKAVGNSIDAQLPSLFLKLMSDCPRMVGYEFPEIGLVELRSLEAVMDGLGRKDCSLFTCSGGKYFFGRKELRGKLPTNFALPSTRLSVKTAGGFQCPVHRLVSRDFFSIELVPQKPQHGSDFWVASSSAMCLDKHARPPLAIVTGVSTGLHVCDDVQEKLWRWVPDGIQVVVQEGARIAVLLADSSSGGMKSVRKQDTKADDAICLLGLEFRSSASM